MKLNIKILIVFLACAVGVYAQTFNPKTPPNATTVTRGYYGTYQSSGIKAGTICAVHSNTVTPLAASVLDTLTNTDTGYVQFQNFNNCDRLFDFSVTKISGTVGGTALLQGSLDNVHWLTITGNTTYYAGAKGASATIADASAHYFWYVPQDQAVTPYYQIQYISTGTMTATYTSSVNTVY